MLSPILITFLLATIILLIYRWFDANYNFWKKKNIPHIPGKSIFGNIRDIVLSRNSPAETLQSLYNDEKTRNEPIVGIQLFYKPALIIRDLELIKKIFVNDFNYFSNRHTSSDPHSDKLGWYNLFFLKNPLWRQVRQQISPIFTAMKIKQFFLLVNSVAENLDKHLRGLSLDAKMKTTCVELRELCALYTTDVIASVAFGINANSIKNPENEFRKNGRNIFNYTPWRSFEFLTFFFLPQFVSFFKCKVFSQESTKFLRSTINYIIQEREKSKQVGNDLIDLLIGLGKTAKVQINNKEIKFDGDLLVAQASIFFAAGYETSSTTMSFALYELSKKMDVQTKLREEIREVLEEHKEEISYDIILKMKYLHMVVQEVLRLYPPLPFLDRECEYPKGDSKGYSLEPVSEFHIPNKMPIILPIYAMHRDEKYFPNPNEFIPERFEPESAHPITPYTYAPFGIGKRICIGERFGVMQTKIGLFYILKNHYVKQTPKTPTTIKLAKKALILQSEGEIYCDIVHDPLIK